jgi:hypothetical protein
MYMLMVENVYVRVDEYEICHFINMKINKKKLGRFFISLELLMSDRLL